MNLPELKKLAEAATPGPWWIDNHGNLSHWRNDNDATFIATANPQTILQMIAVMEQMAEALKTCKREMQGDKWDSLYIDGSLAAYKEMMK